MSSTGSIFALTEDSKCLSFSFWKPHEGVLVHRIEVRIWPKILCAFLSLESVSEYFDSSVYT